MKSSRGYTFLLRWLITLALPFLLVTASVRLLLSHSFLQLEYQRPGFPADPYGFTAADRLEYGMHAIDFLFQAGDASALATLQIERHSCVPHTIDAAYCLLFNSNELRHLQDVKHILTIMFASAVVCGIAIAAALLASQSLPALQRQLRGGLRGGAWLTLTAILTAGRCGNRSLGQRLRPLPRALFCGRHLAFSLQRQSNTALS